MTYSGKADFIAKVVETTNAVLSVFVVVVLDKAKPRNRQCHEGIKIKEEDWNSPLAKTSRVVDDGLGAPDVTKALAPTLEHLVSRLRMKTTDVDIGLATNVLQSSVEGLQRRAGGGDSLRDRGFLVDEHVQTGRDAAVLRHLAEWHAVRSKDLGWGRRALCVHATGRAVDDGDTSSLMEGWVAGV